MDIINMSRELFAHKNLKTEIGGFPLNVAPLANTSEYRSDLNKKGSQPKISTAGLIFDLIFGEEAEKAPRLGIYRTHSLDAAYVIMDGVGYYVSGDRIRSTGKPVHHRTTVIPDVIYAILNGPAELMDRFIKYASSVQDGSFTDSALYAFCDTFYYGWAADHKEIDCDESLTEEEIKRLFDSGDLYFDNLAISEKKFARSKFEKKKKTVKAAVKKAVKGAKSFISRCISGEFAISYDGWDDGQKKLVIDRKYLDTFEATEDFEEIVTAVKKTADRALSLKNEGKDYADVMNAVGIKLNRMLIGKPGTGKTAMMMALSAATGLPYYPVVFSKHTEEDIVEGKTKIVDGHPEFVLTDIPKYWDKGGLFDFEEMNSADPGMLIVFNMALEDPYVINVNGYEKHYRSPLSFVFCCENTGIEGTNPNPPALSNRFQTKWRIQDPTEASFKAILKKKTGQDTKCINWVYEAYTKAVNWLKSPEVGEEELTSLLSMRSCMGCINNMQEGQSPVRAVKNSIVNAVAEADMALAEQMEAEILEDLRDPDFEVKD